MNTANARDKEKRRIKRFVKMYEELKENPSAYDMDAKRLHEVKLGIKTMISDYRRKYG